MTILDPRSSIGKMRLRCGDYSDFPIMPDEVYQSALDDCNNSLPQAVKLVANYILGSLTGQTHQKLAQVEVFGAEWFQNYLAFIKATILNPNFMQITPMPYAPKLLDIRGCETDNPVVEFQKDWNKSYIGCTEAEQTHAFADFRSPYPYFGM